MNAIDILTFDEKGLLPAIVQDADSGEVLMVAYMNREAVRKTVESGVAHFWSRSRGKLWLKGETSGHVQRVREIFTDCDADTLLLKVEQEGGACHNGYRSCFYRKLTEKTDAFEVTGEKIFDPGKVYKK